MPGRPAIGSGSRLASVSLALGPCAGALRPSRECCVQIVGWLVALLLGTGWIASEFPVSPPAPPPAVEAQWRRTSTGWERLEHTPPPPLIDPGFHPALLAVLFVLGSTLSLAAFAEPRRSRAKPVGHSE